MKNMTQKTVEMWGS